MARIVSAPLAAGAYGVERGKPRTHAVELDDLGDVVKVLCGKAKPESVLDDETQYDAQPVNCPDCLRKLEKMKH